MLEEVLNSYREVANSIGWKDYNQNDLFFEYVKNENDKELAEKFYAGIVCRYWGYSGRLYTKCNKHITFEQCYDILLDTINYVLEKRVWENPESSLYNDPNAPDKAFHLVLKRMLGILLAKLTTSKRKANFNTLSIDSLYEEYKDASEGLFGIVDNTSEETNRMIFYISTKEDAFSKIVLHHICFDTWTSLETIAKQLREEEPQYVLDTYFISEEEYERYKKRIKIMNNKVLVNHIKDLLFSLKSDWE